MADIHEVTVKFIAKTEEDAHRLTDEAAKFLNTLGDRIDDVEFKVEKNFDRAFHRTSGVANVDVTAPGGVDGLGGSQQPVSGSAVRPAADQEVAPGS